MSTETINPNHRNYLSAVDNVFTGDADIMREYSKALKRLQPSEIEFINPPNVDHDD